jgi:hypothetical protein
MNPAPRDPVVVVRDVHDATACLLERVRNWRVSLPRPIDLTGVDNQLHGLHQLVAELRQAQPEDKTQ